MASNTPITWWTEVHQMQMQGKSHLILFVEPKTCDFNWFQIDRTQASHVIENDAHDPFAIIAFRIENVWIIRPPLHCKRKRPLTAKNAVRHNANGRVVTKVPNSDFIESDSSDYSKNIRKQPQSIPKVERIEMRVKRRKLFVLKSRKSHVYMHQFGRFNWIQKCRQIQITTLKNHYFLFFVRIFFDERNTRIPSQNHEITHVRNVTYTSYVYKSKSYTRLTAPLFSANFRDFFFFKLTSFQFNRTSKINILFSVERWRQLAWWEKWNRRRKTSSDRNNSFALN